MYKGKTVAVVVPAYNEESQIGKVLDTMPDIVDHIVIVDDASRDGTVSLVESFVQKTRRKAILLKHPRNLGVGAAILTGYEWTRAHGIDVTAVMAADAQMDPLELPLILDPVVEEEADYAKGNRLFTGETWRKMPRIRYLGNSVLSLMTKIASGYWHIADFQCGYTSLSLEALKRMELDTIYKRYGFPNDFLVVLNVYNFRVKDIPIKPVYNVGERSGISLWKVIPRLSSLLFRRFFWRMKEKYVIRDFHPLVFFYLTGMLLYPAGIVFGLYLLFYRILKGPVAPTSALFAALLVISGLQFLFFAMWFDMDYNKRLK
jgi:glycosyltransferase involved in cell wall biosynthesis